MKKSENPFRILYDRVYDYFTASIARRVFFFSIFAVLVCAVVVRFDDSMPAVAALMFSATICALATFADSVQCRRAFVEQLRGLETDFIKRAAEKGEPVKGAFSAEELAFMRKKKREYNYSIAVKFLFVIILVVLFFSLV